MRASWVSVFSINHTLTMRLFSSTTTCAGTLRSIFIPNQYCPKWNIIKKEFEFIPDRIAVLKDRTVWFSFVIVKNDSGVSASLYCQYFVSAAETYTSCFPSGKTKTWIEDPPGSFNTSAGWEKDPFALLKRLIKHRHAKRAWAILFVNHSCLLEFVVCLAW